MKSEENKVPCSWLLDQYPHPSRQLLWVVSPNPWSSVSFTGPVNAPWSASLCAWEHSSEWATGSTEDPQPTGTAAPAQPSDKDWARRAGQALWEPQERAQRPLCPFLPLFLWPAPSSPHWSLDLGSCHSPCAGPSALGELPHCSQGVLRAERQPGFQERAEPAESGCLPGPAPCSGYSICPLVRAPHSIPVLCTRADGRVGTWGSLLVRGMTEQGGRAQSSPQKHPVGHSGKNESKSAALFPLHRCSGHELGQLSSSVPLPLWWCTFIGPGC